MGTNRPSPRERRSFLFFLTGILALTLYMMSSFIMPVLMGTVVVVLSYPIYNWMFLRCKEKAYVASFLSTLSIFLFILVPCILITSLVTTQVFSWLDTLTQFVETEGLSHLLAKWNLSLAPYIAKLESTFNMKLDFAIIAKRVLREVGIFAYEYSPSAAVQTLNFVISFFVMLAVIFFLYVDGRTLLKELLLLSPIRDQHEESLVLEIKKTIFGVVYGSFFTALIQSVLATGAYLFIFNRVEMEGALVWGSVTFFMAFIPFVGAAGVWFPMSLILILSGYTGLGVGLIIFGTLVISGVDNFLKPLLIKGKSDMHTLILFFAIIGGLKLFGPAGILFGPIIVAVLMGALRIYKRDYLISFKRESTS